MGIDGLFCCFRLIDMGIDGFSTTVFCYGQTGSGKTHTLTGPPYLVSVEHWPNQVTKAVLNPPRIKLQKLSKNLLETVVEALSVIEKGTYNFFNFLGAG